MPVDCDAFLYSFRPNDGKEYRAIPHLRAPSAYVYKPVEQPRSTHYSTSDRYGYSSTQPTSPPPKSKKNRCCVVM